MKVVLQHKGREVGTLNNEDEELMLYASEKLARSKEGDRLLATFSNSGEEDAEGRQIFELCGMQVLSGSADFS